MWQHRRLRRDIFLGCGIITESADNVKKSLTSPLVGRGRKKSERHPGELHVEIVTFDDLIKA